MLFRSTRSSATERRHCLPCESFEVTGWTTRHCRLSSGQHPSPDCSTRQTPGGGSPRRPSDSELTRLFAAAHALISCQRTSRRLPSCAKQLTKHSSITLFETPDMFSTTFCRLNLMPHKITNCDPENTTSSCYLTQPTSHLIDCNFINRLLYNLLAN